MNLVAFRRVIVGGAALIMSCTTASATATLSCTIKDAAVEFDMLAHVGSIPNALYQLSQNQLKLNARAGWPETTIHFAASDLGQQWDVDPELRLRMHREAEPGKPETDLVVITKKVSETQYRGQYRLMVKANGKGRNHAGRIICELGY